MLISLRRTVATLAAVGVVLTACGATEDASPNTGELSPATEVPSSDPVLEPTESSDVPAQTEAPAATEAPADTAAVGEPAAEPAEAPVVTEPAAPPVPDAVLGGRAFASELSAASDFAENALPDLQVDDIRRKTKVNLRNVFPAERPVLVWLWAPH